MSDDHSHSALFTWAVVLALLLVVTGGYYEVLRVRDEDQARAARITADAAHRVCVATADGRRNLNRRSEALAHYITVVLRFNAEAQKLSPPPAVLRPLEVEEIAAIKQLRAAQRPLPILHCDHR